MQAGMVAVAFVLVLAQSSTQVCLWEDGEWITVARAVSEAQAVTATWQQPVKDGCATSRFGIRVDPLSGERKFHSGVDIAAPEGSDVHAIAAGVVVHAAEDEFNGNRVVIAHDDGTRSSYSHLCCTTTMPAVRTRVRAGQRIGQVGKTGRVKGVHLHLEVKNAAGRVTNPENLIGRIPVCRARV